MSKIYGKLAMTNIAKNKILYIPFILSGVLMSAFVYMMTFITTNKGIDALVGANDIHAIMGLGTWIIIIFSYIYTFYTNSFLIKRRKKEFGVYNMLGMEKRHICRVLSFETIVIAGIAIVGGILTGIVFSKLLMMLLLHLLKLEVSFEFVIAWNGVQFTAVVFAILYLVILLYNRLQIRHTNTIELIKGGNVGEKEPKTKVVLSLLGFACLFAGYFISITTENPLKVLMLFFVAVLLVIIGTYLLFTTGSIFILKILKKNKKFYYDKRHMTAVSGMLYRMKQNASGLANICILSTMVLVTISTTVSLYAGIEDSVSSMYTHDLQFEARYDHVEPIRKEVEEGIKNEITSNGFDVRNVYSSASFTVGCSLENDMFVAAKKNFDMKGSALITFVTRDSFVNEFSEAGKQVPKLQEDEVFFVADNDYAPSEFNFQGTSAKCVGNLTNFKNPKDAVMLDMLEGIYYVLVKDVDEMNKYYTAHLNSDSETKSKFEVDYEVDISGTAEEKLKLADNHLGDWAIDKRAEGLFGEDAALTFDSKAQGEEMYLVLYGGLLFLGISCGVMFLLVTVMIIFYKQISEGYDDRDRFVVMEKVGMSQQEVKRTINSQVRMVFFLPIVVSFCHLAGAFPMIRRLLALLLLTEPGLFVKCLVITGLIFFAIYYLVFKITSRVYYKIVK